jgi:4'-phosphopantetheinyl transferase
MRDDRLRFLLGRMLMRRALADAGLHGAHIRRSRWGKLLTNACDFNITHAGIYVACVISTTYRVGVDVEQMMPIDPESYSSCWSRNELEHIRRFGNHAFFDLWTKKEAVLKACGVGLIDNLASLDVTNHSVRFNNVTWYTYPITIDGNYKMHVATDIVLDRSPLPEYVSIDTSLQETASPCFLHND